MERSRVIRLAIVSLFIFLLLPLNILADGGMYKHVTTYDKDEWVPITQDKQVSAISYENGKESMIISVTGNLEGSEVAWIFPIPAKPEETTIDIIQEFPEFSGYEVKSKVGYELHDKIPVFTLTQIYPVVYYIFSAYTLGAMSARGGMEKDTGVTIHEHLEMAGLTAELITTKDENKLNNYLSGKNLELPDDSLFIIREYIGKDYSFVVSWISDVTKYKQETGGNVLGIKTEFPTGDLYYPLKLTSIYGEMKIPVSIYVSGHVSPKIYDELEDGTKVNYYGGEKEYTKIEINSKSKLFVKDLWMAQIAPPDILLADFILFNPAIFLIIIFVIISCLASLVSGLIVFRNEFSLKKFVLLGLTNFFTLIGFSIATCILIKEKGKKAGKLITRIFYFLLILTVLLFIIAFAIQSSMFFLLSVLVLFLSIIIGISILAAKSRKKFGFIILFSIIFLILTGMFYYLIISVYPYREYTSSPNVCRAKSVQYCAMWQSMGSPPTTWEDFAPECENYFPMDESLCEEFGIEIESST